MHRLSTRGLFVAVLLVISYSGQAQVTSPDFSVVVLPDTQYYSESHPEIFTAQTQWIVDNVAKYNIQFVIGEGDIVNVADEPAQWQNADASIKLLDSAGIPYVLTLGNHDYDGLLPAGRGTTAYNAYFGPSRYAGYSWYKSGYPSGTNDNFYAVFTVNGKQYLVLALEYVPRDASLDWAKTVLDANPDKEVIVVTHSFMWTDGTRADQCNNNDIDPRNGNQGEDVWQKLLINYPNLSLVLNGHFIGGNASRRADWGLHQNLVNQIFANYQNLTNGGNGWLRIMTFRPSLNRIDVLTYSPYLKQFKDDSNNQFSLTWHSTPSSASEGAIKGQISGQRIAPSPYMCMPISGATLTAGGASATSDSNGTFSLSLSPGNYSLSAAAPGWTAATEEEEGSYPDHPSNAKFFLKPLLGNLGGKVTDGSGNPISGATVALSGGTIPTQVSLSTDTTGSYAASSISVGRYDVTASAIGETTTTTTANVSDATTTTLNIQMSATSTGGGGSGGGATCNGSPLNRTITVCTSQGNQFTMSSGGGTGTAAITVFNSTSATMTVSLSCSPDATTAKCSVDPATLKVPANGSSSVTVSYTVPALTGRLRLAAPFGLPFVFAGVLAGFSCISRKKRALWALLFAAVLAIGMVSCGGGHSTATQTNPAPSVTSSNPSPKVYNFTITATSGSNSDAKKIIVTVQ
jgi:hypothetical protein